MNLLWNVSRIDQQLESFSENKKARSGKSRPLLTYEKHQVQRYKKISLLQRRAVSLDGFFPKAILTIF